MHTNELQDLLNRSVAHVRSQGQPSVKYENPNHGQTCMYKSPKGHGCAAAPFITAYEPGMDDGDNAGAWLKSFTDYWAAHLDPLAVKHREFVRELQECHDNASKMRSTFIQDYEERIRELAARFGLTVPALNS
jgi:hypothetical protein